MAPISDEAPLLLKMFLGEYLHTFDPKNRISLPSRFRKELGRAVVITRGLDRSLYIYAKRAWEKEAAKYAAMASGNAAERGLARLFLSGSSDAEIDGAGRILIPENLKAFAGIQSKAVVAGVADRVEVWEEAAWKRYTKAIERDAEANAEKVGAK
jgi:MraZ protein